MLHLVNRNPSSEDLRKFGVTILIGLGVIGGLLWWFTGEAGARLAWTGRAGQWIAAAMWVLGVGASAIAFSSQSAGRRVYVGWMLVGAAMGMVMLPLFLSVLFFFFLPVFALIRLKDPLRLKLKRGGTYWEKHDPHEATIERMQRLF